MSRRHSCASDPALAGPGGRHGPASRAGMDLCVELLPFKDLFYRVLIPLPKTLIRTCSRGIELLLKILKIDLGVWSSV